MVDLDKFTGGSASARNKLNAMQDLVISSSKIKGGRFIDVSSGHAGTVIAVNLPALIAQLNKSKAALNPVSITELGQDVLTGRYLTPNESGILEAGTVDVEVLKPWTLRVSPFDGQTVNGLTYDFAYGGNYQKCDVTDGSTNETWYVSQPYYVGAVIYVQPANEPDYDVIDVNIDGRAWAKG